MNNPRPKKICLFCEQQVNIIDYKQNQVLRRFMSSYGKILPRKRTGTCSKHQRSLALAIKRARFMAIVPFTTR